MKDDDENHLLPPLRAALTEVSVLRADVARMRPVYEAAKTWRADRQAADAASAELNARLRRGEAVAVTITNPSVMTPDGRVVSLVPSPEDRLAGVVDDALAAEATCR